MLTCAYVFPGRFPLNGHCPGRFGKRGELGYRLLLHRDVEGREHVGAEIGMGRAQAAERLLLLTASRPCIVLGEHQNGHDFLLYKQRMHGLQQFIFLQ